MPVERVAARKVTAQIRCQCRCVLRSLRHAPASTRRRLCWLGFDKCWRRVGKTGAEWWAAKHAPGERSPALEATPSRASDTRAPQLSAGVSGLGSDICWRRVYRSGAESHCRRPCPCAPPRASTRGGSTRADVDVRLFRHPGRMRPRWRRAGRTPGGRTGIRPDRRGRTPGSSAHRRG